MPEPPRSTASEPSEEVIERHEFGSSRADGPGPNRCRHCHRVVKAGHGWERVKDAQGRQFVRHTVPLYFDECIDKETGKALRNLGYCIVSVPSGTGDVAWLEQAGREGWTVITADRQILEKPEEKQAIIDNKVRCFVLSPQPQRADDTFRAFSLMWEKIRSESAFPGPAIWVLRHAERWEQIHPTALEYRPLHLARVPAGHMLNLFADVVKQYDEGFFSAEFVNDLHDEMRIELESRGAHELIRAASSPKTPEGAESFLNAPVPPQGGAVDLDEPVDLNKYRLVIVKVIQRGIEYPILYPARRIRLSASDADFTNTDDHEGFRIDVAPTGFHRSGFGLRPSAARPISPEPGAHRERACREQKKDRETTSNRS